MAVRVYIDEAYKSVLSSAGLAHFDSFMSFSGGTPVSVHEDRDAVRFQVNVGGEWRSLFLKRTRKHSPAEWFRHLVAGRWPVARPVREYAICKRLEGLGIPAMKAIACGQETRWLLPRQGFVVAEAVPGGMTLEKAWRERADGRLRLAPREKREVIRAVARRVARLHGADLHWPDLVSKHILLDLAGRTEPTRPEWDLYLIDLERIETSRSSKRRRRDLVKLLESMPAGGVSRTDLLRFAVAYCGCERVPWSDQRAAIARQFGRGDW